MTEAEAKKIKDPQSLRWDTPCFVFVEGRYYLGMWFIEIPLGREYPHGGNITIQCWRYSATPLEWVFTFRFRRYADASGKIWESSDHKSWHAVKQSGDEAMIEKRGAEITNCIAGATGLYFLITPPKIHTLIFKGDSEKALAIAVQEKPFWLHMKTG